MAAKTWDRFSWTMTDDDGTNQTVLTEGASTWALRALIAAKSDELRPHHSNAGKWRNTVAGLRALGLLIDDLPADDTGRTGYRLACTVERR